ILVDYMRNMLNKQNVNPPTQGDGDLKPEAELTLGNWVFIKVTKKKSRADPRLRGSFQVLLMTLTAVKIAERPSWIHLSHCKKVREFSDHGQNRTLRAVLPQLWQGSCTLRHSHPCPKTLSTTVTRGVRLV
uniref:Murine leukemia virus integrase C-terminal domain-containing protein n=1 Tax=Pygocentrus nattereri TaxID=42514 RepID=A0AAR2KSR6_PYGNA